MPSRIYKHLETLWDFHQLGHAPQPSDCIFILCSNDVRVAEYAAALYRQGFAPYVMISGGFGRFTQGQFVKTEAETFADVLLDEGVPESAILLETKATNTGENVTFGYQIMREKGLDFKKLLLVQKPFMERRAYATFIKQWPGEWESVLVTSPPISLVEYPTEDIPFDMVAEATVSDFERVRDYPTQGFQIEQSIPAHVTAAYDEIKKQGLW
ncbi:YdcF family protein [Enterovibrio makurazakiensis]|uniref:YdcF family protein n=1 Tax=Enterovibrio gelatinilyticus TaxID=2899819 RepID=A0ABT5QZ74_9GAMM|nr:YdcF family protein [Enterovibrio sp. ZSDZ42]MDD1793308.1 YdcF family protein [Enterovibrio sp. ZSDZ42]